MSYQLQEDSEGIAYTDNYFYAYYRNIDGKPIPFASVYMNEYESQDIVNHVNKEIENVRKGERAKFYFDRVAVRFGVIEGANNAYIGGNQSTPSTVRDAVVVQGLLRKGGYYDNPNLYVKTSRTDRRRYVKYSLREATGERLTPAMIRHHMMENVTRHHEQEVNRINRFYDREERQAKALIHSNNFNTVRLIVKSTISKHIAEYGKYNRQNLTYLCAATNCQKLTKIMTYFVVKWNQQKTYKAQINYAFGKNYK